MEPISFALAIIAEARTVVTSVKTRIAKCQEGGGRFQSLSENLDDLLRRISEVEQLYQKSPNALPTGIDSIFQESLTEVRDSFKGAYRTILPSLQNAFPESSTGTRKLKAFVRQLLRANALSDDMTSLQNKIDDATNTLQYLISVLANALKVDTIKVILEERVNETVGEVYIPATSAPAPGHTVVLDFESKDESGKPTNPEGHLKHSVLYGGSSAFITAATGSIKTPYSVLGMAGVGKTVALQGLAYDEDIKERFKDGVHYMEFGRGASPQTAIREIAKIMTLTGATSKVEDVRNATSLRQAVDFAVRWFNGKVCLYLLDDLWPPENLHPGYFQDLRQLLRGSPRNRMIVSTRSVDIAVEAGCVVDFGPRESLGNVSMAIFMAHAKVPGQSGSHASSPTAHELAPSLSKILSICGGLPIALAVTGCAVSKLLRIYRTFEKACDVYSAQLEEKKSWLGDKNVGGGASLNAGMLLSLEYLEFDLTTANVLEVDFNIDDIYTSLCVLPNQTWVSLRVLGRLWQFDKDTTFYVANLFHGMSLGTLHSRSPSPGEPEEVGILLHDLQLDFCRHRAMDRKTLSLWHANLLNGYLGTANHPMSEEPNAIRRETITSFVPRPWWSKDITQDGYIHANICRHLAAAGLVTELAALLLDARWTKLRARIGGTSAIRSDFELFQNVLEQWESRQGQQRLVDDVRGSYETILSAIQFGESTGLLSFLFRVWDRLLLPRTPDLIVRHYVESVEKHIPKPYPLPFTMHTLEWYRNSGICRCFYGMYCTQYFIGGPYRYKLAELRRGAVVQYIEDHPMCRSCKGIPLCAIVRVAESRLALHNQRIPDRVVSAHTSHFIDQCRLGINFVEEE